MEDNINCAVQAEEKEKNIKCDNDGGDEKGFCDSEAPQDMEFEENNATGCERIDDDEEPKTVTVNIKACCVCSDEKASLRCPKCRLKYCNLECYRRHKNENICKMCDEVVQEHKEDSKLSTRQYFYPSKDTLPVTSLEMLCTGQNLDHLKKLLANNNLRNIISHLNRTQNPVEEFRKIMLNEKFVEFTDFILGVLREQSNI